MRVAITGAGGLIGGAVKAALAAGGHVAIRCVRRPARAADEVTWDPDSGALDAAPLSGCDAVLHLAGESLVARRWSSPQKARIRGSRVDATRRLCHSLAALPRPPAALVAASAVGFYGDRGDEVLTETSAPGEGFLAELVRDWEAAAAPAAAAGMRVVHLRSGIVLSRHRGALARMLAPFRLGLGGPFGDGRMYMSWISLADTVAVILRALGDSGLAGPHNVTAPHPATNRDFARALGRALSRPALLPLPAAVLRLVFGEMADAALLASQRAVPERLLAAGFEFRHPRLEGALEAALAGSSARD